MVKTVLFCILLFTALLPGPAAAAPVLQAEVDRNAVGEGESLILTVRASGPSLPGGKPSLGALEKDFEILGQNTRQQLVFANGIAETSSIWQYTLLPKREGTLSIPAIRFGDSETAAIAIAVGQNASAPAVAKPKKQPTQAPAKAQQQAGKQPAQAPAKAQQQAGKQPTQAPAKAQQQAGKKPAQAPAKAQQQARKQPAKAQAPKSPPAPQPKPRPLVFVESKIDRKQVLVQSQVLYTQRVFSAITIQGQVKPLEFRNKIPVHELSNRQYQQAVSGRNYTVHEWVYAIFPQKSGRLRIPPAELNAIDRRSGQRMRKRSAAIQVQVLPRPAAAPGRVWLPARSVKIQEKWSADPDNPMNVGQPVNRTLKIIAEGLIAEQLPSLAPGKIAGVKIYPEKAHLETKKHSRTVKGIRREKTVLIPTRAAPVELPAVELHWWNTEKNSPEVARLPPRTLQVVAGEDIVSDIQVESSNLTAAAGQVNTEDINLSPAPEAAETAFSALPWIIASLGLGGAWLAFTFLWWREWSRRRQQETTGRERLQLRRLAQRQAYRELESACQARDAATARTALLKWVQRQWPENTPRNLTELAGLGGAELRRALEKLDRALYGDSEDSYWDGTSLLAALEKLRRNTTAENSRQKGSALPGLYE